MLRHAFPDLQWLKQQVERKFGNAEGWPNVVLNVKSGPTLRDDIRGPLSLFSNISGVSQVTVDNRTTIVGEDHFFISNTTQRYTLDIPKAAETFNIHFAEDTVAGDFYNKLYPKDEVVKECLRQLSASDKAKLEREVILSQLLFHLHRVHRGEKMKLENLKTAKVSTREETLRRLHLATDHIYSNYQTDISLDDLSRVSMLSKFHFLRAFQQAFGASPHRFLNYVRIEKAKELLASSRLEVIDVGRAVGVNDSSSFSRMFRKETGVYPTIFRSQL